MGYLTETGAVEAEKEIKEWRAKHDALLYQYKACHENHELELKDLRQRCAMAAFDTKLPKYFRWGADAAESFDVGTHQAYLAVLQVPLKKE